MENNSDFESADYYLVLLYSLGGEKVYQFGIDACYPPLAYFFCLLISRSISLAQTLTNIDLFALGYQGQVGMTPELLLKPYSLWVYLMYSLLGVLLYVFACDSLPLSNIQRRLVMLSVIFSVPLLAGALERGNMTIYTAGIVLIAMQLRNSSVPWRRELALILIAIAAGLKFYPAFIGLLYLQEKRWKEAVRLIVYGLISVFAPFVFFGGIDGIKVLLSSLTQLSVQTNHHYRVQYFLGVLSFLKIGGRLASLLNYIFLLVLIVLLFVTRSNVRRLTYLAAMMALFPPNAYRYTILFFLVPLFAWIRDESRKATKLNYSYAVLFGLMFTIPTLFGILTSFRMNFGYYTLSYVELHLYFVVWLFLLAQILQDLNDFTRRKKLEK